MNNNNNKGITPIITYGYAGKDKYTILAENESKSGIYRWTNNINNKSYIGSAKCLKNRLSVYYSINGMNSRLKRARSFIYSALLKYSHGSFKLEILEYCKIDVLIKREQFYMDLLKPEYNICRIANSRLGSKQSEATKIKISINNKGKHDHFSGKTHTDETKQKISLSLKSIIKTNVTPKVLTIDTKLKLSLRSKGVKVKVFDLEKNLIKEFSSISSAAKYFSLSPKGLSRYFNNNKSYMGFTFISKV